MSDQDSTLIYFDTNMYSRPFDDQTQPNIAKETNAFFDIVAEVKANRLALLCSDILDYEADNILSEEKRTKVEDFLVLCSEHVESTDDVLDLGKQVQNSCQIRARDALHVASAILGKARYFLSCDQKVTQKKNGQCYCRLARVHSDNYFSVMDPVRFTKKLNEGDIE